jgi:ribonuclease VapC
MPRFVFDAFALLAYFENEPGAVFIQALIDRASQGEADLYLTVVNLGEILYRLEHLRGPQQPHVALSLIREWRLSIIPVDEALALAAARVKAERRMGYLDCFVVALAQQLDAAVVTGDPDFRRVGDLVRIEWLER